MRLKHLVLAVIRAAEEFFDLRLAVLVVAYEQDGADLHCIPVPPTRGPVQIPYGVSPVD